jgi:hypothetical protein
VPDFLVDRRSRCVVEALLLAGGERVGERLPSLVGQRDVGLGELADGGDVGEVLDRVGELGRVRVEGERGRGVSDEAVAVGRGLHELGSGNGASSPGPVLDHHRLSQQLGENLADRPCGDVGGAAGRKSHRDGDRLFGPGRLRLQGG